MKNVVITGSTRGIGLAMSVEFLKAGCNVTLSGRGEELPAVSKEKLENVGGEYTYISCDVQNKEDIQRLWNLSVKKWGSIDIWINNAGQNTPYSYVYETEQSYIDNVITTNITGMIYGCQIAAKEMLLQKKGAIYSMEGLGSNNMIQEKTILYGTTKCALTYFMKGLAKELKGTEVIAGRLSPGMMLTDFITKSPDGKAASIETNEQFRKIFNILADKPETVAEFFVPRILTNKKNGAQIAWLTNAKATFRFISAPFYKRSII